MPVEYEALRSVLRLDERRVPRKKIYPMEAMVMVYDRESSTKRVVYRPQYKINKYGIPRCTGISESTERVYTDQWHKIIDRNLCMTPNGDFLCYIYKLEKLDGWYRTAEESSSKVVVKVDESCCKHLLQIHG